MQKLAGGPLGRHGSQSVQRSKAAFATFVEQLGNALTLFLIESRDKSFPKALLRAIPPRPTKRSRTLTPGSGTLLTISHDAACPTRGPGWSSPLRHNA